MAGAPPDPIYILRSTGDTVTCLQFVGNYGDKPACLLSGTEKGNIESWDLRTRRVTQTIPAHVGHSVLSVQQLSETSVLTQGRDGCIHTWDCSTPQWINTGQLQQQYLHIEVSRDGGLQEFHLNFILSSMKY